MSAIRLSNINLNLLPALDAVLQECHVTRAAARIGVSQPAMSYTLRQLRDLLDDPLLVRGPQGMIRTARAEELAPRVRAALEELERALTTRQFDPSTSTRGFSIATADSTFYTTLLPLQIRLATTAPGVRLHLGLLGLRPYEERLQSGELDLAIGMALSDHPGVHREVLYDQPYACAARADHPTIRGSLSAEQFAEAEHVIVTRKTTAERTAVDETLAERGLERRIVLQVPSFPLGLAAVRGTDLLLSGPARFLRSPHASIGLQVIDHPLVERTYPVSMAWHARGNGDPANRWLRRQVVEALQAENG
ncbi:MAG: LysR substrate-binding domain-containing protein [Myxococcota bacterium]